MYSHYRQVSLTLAYTTQYNVMQKSYRNVTFEKHAHTHMHQLGVVNAAGPTG